MKKVLVALCAASGLVAGTTGPGLADSLLPVVLSCSDGHSVTLDVDQVTLTSLVTQVDALNSGGTGTTCSLDTTSISASSETAEWTAYDYNPSNRAIYPRNSPNSLPATTAGTVTTFQFRPGIYTALLTTTDPALTGNLTGRTLNDQISLSGPAATFKTQNGGGSCSSDFPATVRFYFRSPSASGPSFPPPGSGLPGLPPAGFYTQFWWSNPISVHLLTGDQSAQPIAASMSDPNEWTDWDGQRGTQFPEAFAEAAAKVQAVGLSFGGDCFFETGVTPVPPVSGETFTSNFGEV